MSVFFTKKPTNFSSNTEVSTVFIERESKILFLKRSEEKICPGLWAIPGGKLEEGETSTQALLREISEELGLHIPPNELDFVDSYFIKHSLMDYKLHLYYWLPTSELKITLNPHEHQDYLWQPKDKIHDLALIEGQYEAFTKVFDEQRR